MADCTKEYQKRNSKKRSLIKGSAKSTLEKHFDMERKPSSQTIAKLANSLRMKKKTVHIWFCNRRQKEKNVKPLTASNTPMTSTSQIPAEIQDSVDSVTPKNMSAPVLSTESGGINLETLLMLNTGNETPITGSESVELPPMESSVQDSILSSDTHNKRKFMEESLKNVLEKHFSKDPKPSTEVIASLADSLRLKRKTVTAWFASRRHKEKINTKRLLKTSTLRKTRLSASRISTNEEIVDKTAKTSTKVVDDNNLPVVELTELELLKLPSLVDTVNINELSQMECSLESSEQESTESPSLPTKKRTVIEEANKEALEKHFHKEPKPSLEVIALLADSLQMKADVVRYWFANRRQKEKLKKPIVKSKRSDKTIHNAASPFSVSCQIADETTETTEATNNTDLVSSATENSSSTVVQLEDVDLIPIADLIYMSQIASSSLPNSTLPSDTASTICRPSEGAFRNGRPWSPISSCRRPLTESNQIEVIEQIPETPRELKKKVRFAERLIKRSMKIGNHNSLDVYAIPLIKSTESSSTFERFSFGNANERVEHRTILVLGASGSCQAKFINGLINFIFDVEQNDDYRFQLINEEETVHTNCIKVYDVHHSGGFRVPFSLTIIAAPSYDVNTNDSQLFRDQNLAKMLLGLFENNRGIHELDMICNVVTETVFNQSFMSIFGKDIAGSITNWQSFNCLGDTCSWQEVIQRFLVALSDKNVKSLSLTKLVLEERKQMEAMTNGLDSLVKISQGKKKETDKAKRMMISCESQIQSTEDEGCFVFEMKKKVQLQPGECAYNCNSCYVTCHDSFVKEENEQSDVYESTIAGFCSICPNRCNLNMHSNQPYRWECVRKETRISSSEIRTSQRNDAEMKWKDIKSKGRDLIMGLEKDLAENGKAMLEHFVATWRCIQRLNKIALNGNSFLTKKVFDVLYNAEQQLRDLGFEDRLASLRN